MKGRKDEGDGITRGREHRRSRRDTNRKQEATERECEATTAGNQGENKAEIGIVRGHKWRTIAEQIHRARTQANALSGNETKLALRSLGA